MAQAQSIYQHGTDFCQVTPAFSTQALPYASFLPFSNILARTTQALSQKIPSLTFLS